MCKLISFDPDRLVGQKYDRTKRSDERAGREGSYMNIQSYLLCALIMGRRRLYHTAQDKLAANCAKSKRSYDK